MMKPIIKIEKNNVELRSLDYMSVETLFDYLAELRNTSLWEEIRDKNVIFSSPSSIEEPSGHQPGMNYAVPTSDYD